MTDAPRRVATFCRVCEPSCGMVAEVADGRLQKLLPDREHPVTRGFACHKGLGFDAIHHDPDRLNQPLKRVGARQPGAAFTALPWDGALDEIATALRGVRERHGSEGIAGYFGNPTAFNTLAVPAVMSLMNALGARRMFNSGTQDCSNKFAGSEAVYGTSTLHPIPDLAHTRYALIFGSNPKVSHMSFISIADPMEALRQARANGAVIRFVNPRRIESATPATGEVIQIRPDTDLYFMAAMLHEIDRAGLFDAQVLAAHGSHVAGLRSFIAPYSAEAVAPVVGIPAESLRGIALEFARAESACVHMSTGVNMGRQGTLCYWLLQMLSFVTGNLDRKGGNLYGAGFYPATRAGKVDATTPFFDSEFGELREIRGALPGNLLADMIESRERPIRALIVLAGNPLLSMGGGERLRRAFDKLELLVVLDLFRNATGELADYLLPCADMLERRDINLCGLGMQSQPFVQYTEAVVAPAHERREEWWILGQLQRRLDPAADAATADPFLRMDRMLAHSGLSVQQLKQAPSQTAVLPPPPTGNFYAQWIQTADRRVDCCPELFTEALARAHAIFSELAGEPSGQLKLINLRNAYMQNSWYHNVEQLKRPRQRDNPLHVSPEDAQRLQLGEGDAIEVSSAWGSVRTQLHVDETLRSGVVAMTHGWGNQQTPGMRVAARYPGSNANALLPSGPGSYEKLSNQAHMTGIPVAVTRV